MSKITCPHCHHYKEECTCRECSYCHCRLPSQEKVLSIELANIVKYLAEQLEFVAKRIEGHCNGEE